MDPHDRVDLDFSSLSAADASDLRALFTSSATHVRKTGRTPQEEFLVTLAGMMDGYLAQLEAAGAQPGEAATSSAGPAVALGDLSGNDLLRGARVLLGMAQAFEQDGREELARVFRCLAGAFADAIQRRTQRSRSLP